MGMKDHYLGIIILEPPSPHTRHPHPPPNTHTHYQFVQVCVQGNVDE